MGGGSERMYQVERQKLEGIAMLGLDHIGYILLDPIKREKLTLGVQAFAITQL